MNTDPVREQLLADAHGMSPEFSEALHQRTLRAMRQATTRRRATGGVVPWWHVGAALAAGLTMAASGYWVYSQPEVLERVPRPNVLVLRDEPQEPAPLSASGRQLQKLLMPPEPPIDDIGQQVRAAAHYVAGQFPSSLPGNSQQRL